MSEPKVVFEFWSQVEGFNAKLLSDGTVRRHLNGMIYKNGTDQEVVAAYIARLTSALAEKNKEIIEEHKHFAAHVAEIERLTLALTAQGERLAKATEALKAVKKDHAYQKLSGAPHFTSAPTEMEMKATSTKRMLALVDAALSTHANAAQDQRGGGA